jgi:hypothetical protein
MTTVTLQLSVEPTDDTDASGNKLCYVIEEILGTSYDPIRYGPMPCVSTEAFCRIRRDRFRTAITKDGGIYIIPRNIN